MYTFTTCIGLGSSSGK
uniref:Uncharacterized protein n=1 Tax=Arundo donax TaxID=35708 RepID=A0A0A9BMY1_ARUDO